MNIAVGLVEGRPSVSLVLQGDFKDESGRVFSAGRHDFGSPVTPRPTRSGNAFFLDEVTIGVGFHWERSRQLGFRGSLRILEVGGGLTAVNDVELETYVESVIASEMSADSPIELLKAHAVISRSWISARLEDAGGTGTFRLEREIGPRAWDVLSWYGRESHDAFDVCGDDHCQRYQGLAGDRAPSVRRATEETAGRTLVFEGQVCDARFSKCCGGVTEVYRTAWEDRDVPYLRSVYDGKGPVPQVGEEWFRSSPPAYCNTRDGALLSRVLPGFDQETSDFYRWRVRYSAGEVSELVENRSGLDLGEIQSLEALERGPSGRLMRLKITGRRGVLTLGKELEIRRVLSRSHLYSSGFSVDRSPEGFELSGVGWGHGVGLCQIGAAAMAEDGFPYEEILRHYYPGAALSTASQSASTSRGLARED